MELLVACYVAYLVVCGVLGIIGNAIIIRVFQKRLQKLSTDILIITLAVVDLLSSALLIAAIIWAVNLSFRTRFNCVLFWFFRRAFACESALLASVIAIDRYVMVCSPFKLKTSRKKGTFWVVASNAFCLIICIPFISHGNAVGAVCVYKGLAWINTAYGMILILIYLLACISCSFCYTMIFRKIKHHREKTAYMQAGIASTVSTKDMGNSDFPQKEPGTTNGVDGDHLEGGHASRNDGPSNQKGSVSEPAHSRVAFGENHLSIPAISSSLDHPNSSNKGHFNVKNQVSPATPAPVASDATSAPAPKSKPRTKKDQMTKMMFIVTIIYVFSCIPVLILENLPRRYIVQMQQTTAGEGTVNFLYQMRLINHIINVFVYYGVNEKFRRETNALFIKPAGN
ncbi:opsin Rh1-like [Strongylocentrotus purpuratus]|uniref:G-protein coupled receptors family 1 profile domain-containing protein n=1 Tax=Strongylocentrotus purpuratus TaxID=7668 RepID=A0A7M7NY57_STRPU|nr:opsin Rh1-like [Strongylocentrotus purpuratus]|eukprot:XP_003729246.1 PREDICTED: opsin Rh1-like [Strongylocentrotus purpuratus]